MKWLDGCSQCFLHFLTRFVFAFFFSSLGSKEQHHNIMLVFSVQDFMSVINSEVSVGLCIGRGLYTVYMFRLHIYTLTEITHSQPYVRVFTENREMWMQIKYCLTMFYSGFEFILTSLNFSALSYHFFLWGLCGTSCLFFFFLSLSLSHSDRFLMFCTCSLRPGASFWSCLQRCDRQLFHRVLDQTQEQGVWIQDHTHSSTRR